MREYKIEYQTTNHYEDGVSDAIFEILVHPCNDNTQVVTSSKHNSSLGTEFFRYKNFFGFNVQRLRTTKDFKTFRFNMVCNVQKIPQPAYNAGVSVDDQLAVLDSMDFYVDNHFFIGHTNFTRPGKKLEKKMLVYDRKAPVGDFLEELLHYVHGIIRYEKETTDVSTTAEDAVRLGMGVCQDFSHIFIAIARVSRIPTRYVSGYLFQGSGDVLGADMMHAWVEAFIPFMGWVGYDPANNCMVNENYIKVAHGVDYTDCSPLRGVIRTNGKNTTAYSVRVQAQ